MTEAARRIDNFNAGPAVLPRPVLDFLQRELLDTAGSGLSILEMSHRSAEFGAIADAAEADLRALLAIPDDYAVLFMQGGATAQFALTVQNLDRCGKVAFANTGHWSTKAIKTAALLTDVVEVATLVETEEQGRTRVAVPPVHEWHIPDDAAYLHLTDNETISGVALADLPDTSLPIVVDMSSSILSRPIDVSRYALIYAGAQKNIGPAGLTLVIASKAFLEEHRPQQALPPVFDYRAVAAANSLLNTPPCFAWYAAGLVFKWLLDEGGLSAMAARNQKQASALYAAIDDNPAYINRVASANRSWMNVAFELVDSSATAAFLDAAVAAGFSGLKGHKSVGGVRASLYNAQTDAAVDRLLQFMQAFAAQEAQVTP